MTRCVLETAFTYLPRIRPLVTANLGPVTGGFESLFGVRTSSQAIVLVDGEPVVQATVVSASLIRAIFPQVLLQGLVEVIDIYGDSASTDFLYESLEGDPPQIDEITPAQGHRLGGETVLLLGEHFERDARVFFGALEAPSVLFLSDSTLEVVTPASGAGIVDIRLVNPDGREATGLGFEFISPVLKSLR